MKTRIKLLKKQVKEALPEAKESVVMFSSGILGGAHLVSQSITDGISNLEADLMSTVFDDDKSTIKFKRRSITRAKQKRIRNEFREIINQMDQLKPSL